jgi:hypothetical protein
MSTYPRSLSRASGLDLTTMCHPAQNTVPVTIATHITPPFASSPQSPTNHNYGRFNMHNQNDSGSWTQSHTQPDLQHQNLLESAAQNIYTTSQPSSFSLNQILPLPQSIFSQHQETNKADQIISLRIRVAVLENELSHAKKEKVAVETSLGIVIESLTRLHNSNATPSSTNGGDAALGADRREVRIDAKGLEKEIERLRKENRGLRQQAREQRRSYLAHSHSADREDQLVNEREDVHFQPRTPVQRASSSIGKIKSKGKERVQDSFENGVLQVLEPETLIGSWGNPAFDSSFDAAGPSPYKLNDSFGSGGSTTVPNTPLLSPTEFDVSFADVGLHSLEENMKMDSDGFPPALSFDSGKGRTANNDVQNGGEEGEEEKDIDKQLEEQRAVMVKFNNVPKPGVLKVGFDVEGSKRGEEYDFTSLSSLKASNYSRSHSMRDYNRFGPPTGPKAMIGDGTSFEAPKDMSFNSTLWKEKEDFDGAVEMHMRACTNRDMRFPDFFRYGIQYVPSASDSNYLRTVMVTNLPLDTELRDVLTRVKGGEVLSASLLDTGKLMGNLSARVVFRHEAAAEEYALYARDHPIRFGDGEKQAEVTLIETPTYPLNPRASARLQAHQQTRCLSLPNFPTTFSLNSLERNLSCGNGIRAEMLVEMWIDEVGTLHLQFSSVEEAGKAFGILGAWQMYRGLDVRFEQDPCAGEVEELQSPVKPRPPVFPHNWAALEKANEELRARSIGVNGELLDNQRKIFASLEGRGDCVVQDVEGMRRKRLATLSNQKVEIPSFNGKEILGASWADEVIEEAESGDPSLSSPTASAPNPPPNSPIRNSDILANGREKDGAQPINEKINAIMVDNVNEMMFQGSSEWWTDSGLHKPPVGLAGSKYAALVPAFSGLSEKKRVAGRRSSDSHCQDEDPTSNHLAHDSTSTSATNLKPEPETHLHLLQEVARSTPSNTSTSSSPTPIFPSTSHNEKAIHRLLVLDKHAPMPVPVPVLPSSDHNNRLNTSPPRINLQDLLASSPSSSSPNTSPPQYPHPRLYLSPPSKPNANANPKNEDEEKKEDRNHEGVMRIPRGPKEYGFKGFGSNGGGLKGKRYDTLEAEIDEVNLRMPISARDVEVDELSFISADGYGDGEVGGKEKGKEGVNPDEIFLDLDLDIDLDSTGDADAGDETVDEGVIA